MSDFEENRDEQIASREKLDIFEHYRHLFSRLFDRFEFTNLMVRYSELGTKAQEFRNRMETEIVSGIKTVLKRHNIEPTRHFIESGRIYFSFRKPDMKLGSFLILNIPGVDSVSPIIKTDIQTEHIVKKSVEYYSTVMNPEEPIEIKLRLVQQQKKGYKNQDEQRKIISTTVGAIKKEIDHIKINKSDKIKQIESKRPLYIEIRDEFTYIYSEKIYGFRPGLPIDDRKSSVSMYVGRVADISAMERIIRRGQHVLPIYFSTENNSKQDTTLQLLRSFQSFYPVDTFYVIQVNLEPILLELLSILSEKNQNYLCALCRYLRFYVLDTLCSEIKNPLISLFKTIQNKNNNNNKVSNFAFMMRVERELDEVEKKKQNLYYRQQKQLVSQLTLRKFRGIVDGESWNQENLYCPISAEFWKTTNNIAQPIFQPNLILEPSEMVHPIESSYKSIHFIDTLMNERKEKGLNEESISDDIKYTEFIKQENCIEFIQNEICSHKKELIGFNSKDLQNILKTLDINNLKSKIIQDMQLLKIF